MRRFTKLTLLLAMLIMASSNLYAGSPDDGSIFSKGTGSNSTVAGFNNTALETNSIAVGYENTASAVNGSAVGILNTVSGYGSSAFGNHNTVSTSNSSAFGFINTASGEGSSAFGHRNVASGLNSSAFGNCSLASAENSTAIGYQAVAKVKNTVSFGHGIGDDKAFGGGTYGEELNSRLVHVAAGIDDTDAVNVGQFNDRTSGLQSDIDDVKIQLFTYDTYITSDGLTASGKKITNVLAGTADTDAVNYGQFKLAYTDASFDSDKSQLTLTTASGETNVIDIPTGSSLTEEQFAAANSGITSAKVTAYDTYITSDGLTAGSKKITNVLAGTADTDAVNYGQFKLAYTDASFDSGTSQLTLTTASGDDKVIDIPTGGGSSLTEAQLAAANSGITSAKVTAYDTYITSTGITGGNKRITNVADATEDGDAVNYGQMKKYVADNGGGSGTDPDLKKTIEQHTSDIKKLLANLGSSAEKENKPSEGSIAIGDSNEAGTEENTSMAIGSGNKVTGKDSIAIGYSSNGTGNTVSGNNSIAVGFGHQITGNNSGAFGDPSYIDTDNSYAVGNNNNISGAEGFIVGNNSNVSGVNGMAFGSNSKITAENGVALGNNTEVSAKNAVAIGEGSKATEEDTVSVGSDSKQRRITNVDKAQNGTDAVNYDQMKDYVAANAGGGDPQEILRLRSDMGKLDSRISKVGASAAALAALKPMEFDPDNKWSAGVGFGNLNGKSAAAVGIFYRPNRDVYYSLGGNVGGEENIVNAGISFSFGHRSARPAVNQFASADNAEVEAFRQENAQLKDKVAAQDSEIVSLKNKNEDMEVRMKRLERLIIKMSKEDK